MKRSLRFLSFAFLAVILIITMVLRQPAQAAATCAEVYVVRPGDTLFRIGLRYGLQWTVLQALNALPNPNLIFVGERLCVRRTGQPRVATVAANKGTGGSPAIVTMKDSVLDAKAIPISAAMPSTTARLPGVTRWL